MRRPREERPGCRPISSRVRRAPLSTTASVAAVLLAAGLAAGCSPQVIKRGHQFQDSDLQQVQPGMSQEQVRMSLGSPATTASVPGGNAYYYISSTMTQTAFLPEKEVDRQVVAVYFSQVGTVDRVANYGMKDGKVFDLISRTTPAPGGREDGIIKQLFRNLGYKQLYGD
jgi:outer membrane protein assembly factor BamE (lipoprotein component of BamABCDE complex)